MTKHLILMGDSVFDNQSYVPAGHSVLDHLTNEFLFTKEVRVTSLAVDGNVCADVQYRTGLIAEDMTHIALSVGGNDALGCLPALNRSCNHMMEALTDLRALQVGFAHEYCELLEYLDVMDVPKLVCTVYDGVPGLSEPLKGALSMFNDVITRVALSLGYAILDLRPLLNEADDFSTHSPIEPSSKGGKKIAQAIARWCEEAT